MKRSRDDEEVKDGPKRQHLGEEPTHLTLRLLVGSKSAGHVLGKKGLTINRIRSESGAGVEISKKQGQLPSSAPASAHDRIVTISGSIACVINAALMVAEVSSSSAHTLSASLLGSAVPSASASASIPASASASASASSSSSSSSSSSLSASLSSPFPPESSSLSNGNNCDNNSGNNNSTVTDKPEQPQQLSQPLNSSPNSSPAASPPPNTTPSAPANSGISITLLVVNIQVGRLVGKGGSTIKLTREQSGAEIRISKETLEGSDEKSVAIRGSVEVVRSALIIISQQLAMDNANDLKIRTSRLYVPGGSLSVNSALFFNPMTNPSYGSQYGLGGLGFPGLGGLGSSSTPFSYPQVAYPSPSSASTSTSASLSDPSSLFSAQQSAYYQSASPYLPTPTQQTQQSANTQSRFPQQQQGSGPLETMVVSVPKGLAGAVIGRKGATIAEIRQRSGANIRIDQGTSGPTGSDRAVTITGTRQQNEIAVALVYEKMNTVGPSQ